MYLQLLKNDLKTNPLNNFILLMFMTLSIAISISVFLMLGQLFSSISDMYESAKPPHFLQMHKGEIEQEKIDAFNETYEGMEYWQTVSMIDVAGEDLVVTKGEASEKEAINTKGDASEVISADSKDKEEFILADCRLDISLVKQNAAYDVLLDENREKFEVAEGEIGAPVILLSKYSISVGDEITLRSGEGEKQFKVAGFVYDEQDEFHSLLFHQIFD